MFAQDAHCATLCPLCNTDDGDRVCEGTTSGESQTMDQQQIPDPSSDSKLNPCLCSISWSSVVLGGGRWPEAGGGILQFLPSNPPANQKSASSPELLNIPIFSFGRGIIVQSIYPPLVCKVLYAVVDSRWPQKPGLCIDVTGAVGQPDGMVATVGTSAM